MDLVKLGQIAGVAGIAVGALVLVFRSLVEKAMGGVPAKDRARTVRTIALCAFGIGLAGIAASLLDRGTSVVTRGTRSPGVVAGGGVSIGPGDAPAAPSPGPAPASGATPAAPPAGARVETYGARSPGVAAGGDVRIQSDGGTSSHR